MQRFLFDLREVYDLLQVHASIDAEICDIECVISHMMSGYIYSNKHECEYAKDQLEKITNQELSEELYNIILVRFIEPIYQTIADSIENSEDVLLDSENSLKIKYTLLNESDLYIVFNEKRDRVNDDMKRYYKESIENGDYIPERQRIALEIINGRY